jgi:hypothetical protein
VKGVFGDECRPDDVSLRDGLPIAEGGEQIPRQQCCGGLLEVDPGVPAVWHVRRVDSTQALSPEVHDLAVLERPGRRSARSFTVVRQPMRP